MFGLAINKHWCFILLAQKNSRADQLTVYPIDTLKINYFSTFPGVGWLRSLCVRLVVQPLCHWFLLKDIIFIDYRMPKNNVSSLDFFRFTPWTKSSWTKVFLDNCHLDKILLGQQFVGQTSLGQLLQHLHKFSDSAEY